MTAIILTWNNSKTVKIVENQFGGPMTFESVESADAWSWDNSQEIESYMRIVDLDD